MHRMPLALFWLLAWAATGRAQDKTQPAPPVQQAPPPRTLPEQSPLPQPLLPPGWHMNPQTGEWLDPQGTHWKFDGLRWRVLWTDKTWYPVIPPGPLPLNWPRSDLGKGWSQVLPPSSSIWHIVPPGPGFMPPPFYAPPPPYVYNQRYTGPYGVGRRRWRY